MKETNQKQEIIATRKGGFGGSDAKMFYKVGQKGIEALSDTDKRRIAVALGQVEYIETPTTEAMEAGNEFEKWLAENFYTEDYENNFRIEPKKPMSVNFKVFAHADFYYSTLGRVIEAKYTSSDAQQTKRDYMAQLQWYYMLGADQVFLDKGYQGQPFDVNDEFFIERNDAYIKKL